MRHSEEDYNKISSRIRENSLVIFHGFNQTQYRFIKNLPESVKKIWLFWGYDGYGAVPSSKYLKFSSFKLTFSNSITDKIKLITNFGYNYFVRAHNRKAIALIKKMDYCATWIDKDYDLAKKYNKNIKRLYFNYYTKDFMNLEEITIEKTDMERVFLGNSANHTNNHIEALKYLKKKSFTGEIICPLSYGGDKIYVNNIVKYGDKLFNGRFIPLKEFMTLDKYQQLINSCGIVWMNHIRQQAAGNLLAAFCSGKIVVLDANNPMNNTFKKWGLVFFEKEDIFNSKEISEGLLSKNRGIILEKVTIEANRSFFNKIIMLTDLQN